MTERIQYNSKDENNEDDEDSNNEDSDEQDQESFYIYDCVGCKNIFRDRDDMNKYNVTSCVHS